MTDDSRAEGQDEAAQVEGSSMGETRPGERMRRESGAAGLVRGGAGRGLRPAAERGSRPKEQHQGWRGGGGRRRLRRRCAAAGDVLVVGIGRGCWFFWLRVGVLEGAGVRL